MYTLRERTRVQNYTVKEALLSQTNVPIFAAVCEATARRNSTLVKQFEGRNMIIDLKSANSWATEYKDFTHTVKHVGACAVADGHFVNESQKCMSFRQQSIAPGIFPTFFGCSDYCCAFFKEN